MKYQILILAALMLALTACSPSSYEVVEIPVRQADLYPLSQTKEGITVAVDEITNSARSKQYFGVDMFEYGIVPINVVISNHSDRRQLVSPSDILLLRGRQTIVDPLPVQNITNLVSRDYSHLDYVTVDQINNYLDDLTLQEIVLMPDQVYQGVLFFLAEQPEKGKRSRHFNVTSLYRTGALNVQVGIADLETRERKLFGPFPISLR
jgi:hypothetical protein